MLKTVVIAANAQDHHVSVKTKNVLKWLKSGHEVRVQIEGKPDRQKAMENIYKQIEKLVKNGADVKQKVVKAEAIKFNLKPTAQAANLVVDESTADDASRELDQITEGQDMLSDDFGKELEKSIEKEKGRGKKR